MLSEKTLVAVLTGSVRIPSGLVEKSSADGKRRASETRIAQQLRDRQKAAETAAKDAAWRALLPAGYIDAQTRVDAADDAVKEAQAAHNRASAKMPTAVAPSAPGFLEYVSRLTELQTPGADGVAPMVGIVADIAETGRDLAEARKAYAAAIAERDALGACVPRESVELDDVTRDRLREGRDVTEELAGLADRAKGCLFALRDWQRGHNSGLAPVLDAVKRIMV